MRPTGWYVPFRRIMCFIAGHRVGHAYWNLRTLEGQATCSRCGHVGPANEWGQLR